MSMLLRICSFLLGLACVACARHERRVQTSIDRVMDATVGQAAPSRQARGQSPRRSLASLLLASRGPAVGWQVIGSSKSSPVKIFKANQGLSSSAVPQRIFDLNMIAEDIDVWPDGGSFEECLAAVPKLAPAEAQAIRLGALRRLTAVSGMAALQRLAALPTESMQKPPEDDVARWATKCEAQGLSEAELSQLLDALDAALA